MIVISKDNEKKYISILELDGTLKKKIIDYSAYDFYSTHDKIIFTNYEGNKTFYFCKKSHVIKDLPYVLHLKGIKLNDEFLCYSEFEGKEGFLIVSLKSLEIIKKIDINFGFGNIKGWINGVFFSTKEWLGVLGVFDIKGNCIWQIDVSESCSYIINDCFEKAKINNIYYDEKFLYVLAGVSILKLEIETGEILWHTKLDTWQSRGVLENNFLYTTSNGTLNKVGIDTGEIIYSFEMDAIEVNDKKILGLIKDLVWKDNSIWTLIDGKPNAIIEIDSKDGRFKNVFLLENFYIFSTPLILKFYEDKLYILDIDNTLHILEIENKVVS